MRMTRRGLQLALGVLWLLAGYTIAFSKFVAGATKLPQAAVAADLKGHVSTLEAAIKRADRPARPARSRDRIRRADRRGQCRQPEGTRGTGRRFRAQSEHRPARRRHRQRLRRARSAAVPETLERPHRLLRQLHARRRHSRQSQGCHCTEGPERLHRPVQHLHLRCHQATEIRRSRRLTGHVSTLEAAINAIVAGSSSASVKLQMAENHMAGTAAVLAQGIAASMPARFTS
jgi:hypothetical protein